MPTLEDTIEFQASTLNDLLEADAKAVALPSAGEGKYRSWAYVATAAAGILAVLLVASLVTGGRGKSSSASGGTSTKTYPGAHVPVRVIGIPTDVKPDVYVRVVKDGKPILLGVPVVAVKPAQGGALVAMVELALTDEESAILNEALPKGDEKVRVERVNGPAATPTTGPAATSTSAPPASAPPESAPAQTPPTS